jgi:hypothetical protein
VRLQSRDTHEPVGDSIPLASAPALDYLAGYDIGYRLPASGQANQFQRVALSIAAAPDGQPSQPYNAEPVTTRVAPDVVGDLVRFRLEPLAGNPFVGIRAPAPPGRRARSGAR